MSKIIQVTDKYRVSVVPHNYQLQEYIEGGDLVKNPKTGEMQERQSGWVSRDIFYPNLVSIVKYISKLEADDKARDLKSWLTRFDEIVNSFDKQQEEK